MTWIVKGIARLKSLHLRRLASDIFDSIFLPKEKKAYQEAELEVKMNLYSFDLERAFKAVQGESARKHYMAVKGFRHDEKQKLAHLFLCQACQHNDIASIEFILHSPHLGKDLPHAQVGWMTGFHLQKAWDAGGLEGVRHLVINEGLQLTEEMHASLHTPVLKVFEAKALKDKLQEELHVQCPWTVRRKI